MSSKLFIGTIDSRGNIDCRPTIADFAPDGTLIAHRPLTPPEPPSTVFISSLLQIN